MKFKLISINNNSNDPTIPFLFWNFKLIPEKERDLDELHKLRESLRYKSIDVEIKIIK